MTTDDMLIQEITEGDELDLLGQNQATYESASPHRARLWLLGGGGFLLLLLVSVWSIWITLGGYTQYGPAAAFFWGLPWLAAALVLWLIWLFAFALVLRPTHQKVEVYKNGMVVFHRPPYALRSGRRIVLWDQITGITVSTQSGSGSGKITHRLRLFLKPQKVIQLNEKPSGIAGLPELISRIKVNVYMRLLPAFRSSLQNGAVVAFGPVSLQKNEITIHHLGRTVTIPWSKVHQVNAQSGYLVVELEPQDGAQPVYRFPVSQIPNIELLFQLIREDIEA